VIGTVLRWLLLVDMVVLAVAAWMQGSWLINTQIAYVTSALVMGGSMFSYANMIRQRLAVAAIPEGGDRDIIDQLEDPHDLYSDPEPSVEPEPVSAEEIKVAIREEKTRMKAQRRTVAQGLRDSRAAMSLYRLGAYGVLIFGFFYLRGHHVFQPLPYLAGLAVPIVVIIFVLVSRGGKR